MLSYFLSLGDSSRGDAQDIDSGSARSVNTPVVWGAAALSLHHQIDDQTFHRTCRRQMQPQVSTTDEEGRLAVRGRICN